MARAGRIHGRRAVTIVDAFRLVHWDSNDYGVAVRDTWLSVKRGRPSAGIQSLMWIGSHALGRWYQRRGSRDDACLLRDISAGAEIHTVDRRAFPDIESVRIPINEGHSWRGSIMLAPEDEGDNLLFYAKTFV